MADQADPDTRFQIDGNILEYLLYKATKCVLEDACRSNRDPRRETELSLQLVDSFLVLFQSNNIDRNVSPTIKFQLQLLRFVTLFTRRASTYHTGLQPRSLRRLRKEQECRADIFHAHITLFEGLDLSSFTDEQPIPSKLRQPYQRLPEKSSAVEFDASMPQGELESFSLLDSLPMFVSLSASQILLHNTSITEPWMQLAAQYMASAVLEQHLKYGASNLRPLRLAFAFGFNQDSRNANASADELAVTDVFRSKEGDREVEEWTRIRRERLQALVPPAGISLQKHLEHVERNELPLAEFESTLVTFLSKMMDAQPLPMLVQLEQGRVDGLTREQSRSLRDKMLVSFQ